MPQEIRARVARVASSSDSLGDGQGPCQMVLLVLAILTIDMFIDRVFKTGFCSTIDHAVADAGLIAAFFCGESFVHLRLRFRMTRCFMKLNRATRN